MSRRSAYVVGLTIGVVAELFIFLFANDTLVVPFFALLAIVLGLARKRKTLLDENEGAFGVSVACGVIAAYVVLFLALLT